MHLARFCIYDRCHDSIETDADRRHTMTRGHLSGLDMAAALAVLIAIPVAIYHYSSGRYGNGIIATAALIVAALIIYRDYRVGTGGPPQ
jgi:ABC-type proline/glycine betaine transport system permease subunit